MKPTLGVIATSGDLFARELFAALADRYHVEYLTSPDPHVDLLWCDWADQALVQLTRTPLRSPLIARFHSYEAFTPHPDHVNWRRVEALVFVAEHIQRRVRPRIGLADDQIHLIPNGVDVARFAPAEVAPASRRTRIAWVGRLAPVKGLDLLPHLLLAAREVDSTFTLHLAGAFEDPRTEAAFRHTLQAMQLEEAVEICGHLPREALPGWYRQHGYLLSSSTWESFQYAVAEGAACGLVPLVRQWEGADTLYDHHFHHWSTIPQLQTHLARLHALDDATFAAAGQAARGLVVQRYARERQVEATAALIDGVLARRPRRFHPSAPSTPPPRLSAAMILKNEEDRLPACLESIRGIVDEIVVVDTGSTDRTCEIAAAHGARIYHHPWQHDFSLHRNQSLDHATGDWILIIDGDELLTPGNLKEVLHLVHANPQVDALSIRIDGVTDAGLAEQIEAIRVFRRGKGRYRYPVHNQLEGPTLCAPTTAAITAFYVGTLEEKAVRSVPMLLRLAEQEDARAHAAFFLAKTLRALGQFEALRPWTAECRRLVPAAPGYAAFWLWEIDAALVLEGMDAAESALAEAQTHHPNFTELSRYQAAFALFRWQEKALLPGPYRSASVTGERYAVNIPAAAQALGLPLDFQRRSVQTEEIDAGPPSVRASALHGDARPPENDASSTFELDSATPPGATMPED